MRWNRSDRNGPVRPKSDQVNDSTEIWTNFVIYLLLAIKLMIMTLGIYLTVMLLYIASVGDVRV